MARGYSHVVIGAGAIGAATAYWLTRQGAERVLVLEQYDLVNTLGSSGDHSRIIRHAYHSPDYTALTPAMFAAWKEIEARSGLSLYLRTGGLDLAHAGTEGHRDLLGYRHALDVAHLPYEDLTVAEIRRRYPQWRLDEDVVGLYQEAGGLLDIRKSVSAHTSLAMAAGVEFRPRTRVDRVTLRPGSVAVHTADEVVDAGHLVVAAGSWLPELMADLGLSYRLTLSQEQVSYFASRDLGAFAPDRFPIWIYHGEEAGVFYGFPVYGEAAVKLARDMRGHYIDSGSRRFDGDDEEAAILLAFLTRHLPGAVGPRLLNRTCVYDMPADREFVLDTVPGHPHVAVFNGAGHAGKFASLVGRILAELMTAGSTRHPIGPFSLTRRAIVDPDFPPAFQLTGQPA